MNSAVSPAAVLIRHRVADYAKWKKVFDEVQPMRSKAGILGHDISHDPDDPNMLYVYCPAGHPERLRDHIESQELITAMKQAGVEGKPEFTLMKPITANADPEKMLPAIVVDHEVESYEEWREVYDDAWALREKFAVIGDALNQEIDDPNRVIVYNQAESFDKLREMAESNDLKEAMGKAGVVGEPKVYFLQVVDIAFYEY